MNTPLPEGAFNESSSPESSSSGVSKKRKASDAYLQIQKKHLHIQQTIVRQRHEHHGRIIAIQEKTLATHADNQKSQQYRNAIAESN
jgi:ribosome maturation factor RimP